MNEHSHSALRRTVTALIALVFAATVLGGLLWADWRQRTEEDDIRAVLDAQAAAWNRGDLEGFMTGYWNSEQLTFFSGSDPKHGWQATIDRYRKKYQGADREMGQLTFDALDIVVINGRHAWVRGRWKLVTSKETFGGLFTLIVEKKPEGWRIVHDHTS